MKKTFEFKGEERDNGVDINLNFEGFTNIEMAGLLVAGLFDLMMEEGEKRPFLEVKM